MAISLSPHKKEKKKKVKVVEKEPFFKPLATERRRKQIVFITTQYIYTKIEYKQTTKYKRTLLCSLLLFPLLSF